MTELKYIGKFQPKGMIIDVKEEDVKRNLDSGEYERLSSSPKKVVEEKKQPNKSWTELEIYDWIKLKKIPINYKPSRDRKDDVLSKLKERGFIDDDSK